MNISTGYRNNWQSGVLELDQRLQGQGISGDSTDIDGSIASKTAVESQPEAYHPSILE